MPPKVTVKSTFDFKLMARRAPKITALGINGVADILRDDMKGGVARGQDIRGGKLEPLEPSTVRSKRRKGSPTARKPLLDTGRMIGAGAQRGRTGIFVKIRANAKRLSAMITVPQNRQLIGTVHNEGDGQPMRRFFYIIGIDKVTRPRAKMDKVLNLTTQKIARSARK